MFRDILFTIESTNILTENALLAFGEFSLPLLISIMIVLFFGMGWHEYAHAVVANWWGDPTPRENDRLTPNPMVHIYWPGWFMFVFLGFGILGSVPINPRRMRDPRWGSFWTTLAGPLSNLVMAFIFAVLLRLMANPIEGIALLAQPGAVADARDMILLLFTVGVYFNVLLFIFNLLPFFPLDGWHIMLALLPGIGMSRNQVPSWVRVNLPPIAKFLEQPAYQWRQWAQLSQYIFLGLIIMSFLPGLPSIFGILIGQPTFSIMTFLLGL